MRYLATTILLLGFAARAFAGPDEDYKEASAASFRGDYPTALRLFRSAADLGHAGAQFSLGEAYRHGFGVEKNDAEALKWYRLAADQGDAWGQHSVGLMYATGSAAVPQDLVTALVWLDLAAVNSPLPGLMIPVRDMVARMMTPEQIAEAQALAREWRPTKRSK
jgi:TPR repeat protein